MEHNKARPFKENQPHFIDVLSPFCKNCRKTCSDSGRGCPDWMAWYVANWNLTIHRDISGRKNHSANRQVWQYEHPDLVRDAKRREMGAEYDILPGQMEMEDFLGEDADE